MRKLKCKSDHFFCDNFFPSFSIFRDMLADGLYTHGTVRTHCEGLPNNLKQHIIYNQLDRREIITLQCLHQPNVIAIVRQGTKPVTATSTNAQSLPHNEVTSRTKTGEKEIFMPSKYYIIL